MWKIMVRCWPRGNYVPIALVPIRIRTNTTSANRQGLPRTPSRCNGYSNNSGQLNIWIRVTNNFEPLSHRRTAYVLWLWTFWLAREHYVSQPARTNKTETHSPTRVCAHKAKSLRVWYSSWIAINIFTRSYRVLGSSAALLWSECIIISTQWQAAADVCEGIDYLINLAEVSSSLYRGAIANRWLRYAKH